MARAVAATATAETLEAHYQKGLGYMNMGRYEEAKTELEQVFEVDPNYKDVQTRIAEVELAIRSRATNTPTPPPTATVTATPRPKVVVEIWAKQEWQNSGVMVKVGDQISVFALGRWSHGTQDGGMPYYGPEGYNKYDNDALLRTAKVGSLICRIGSGTPFAIGTGTSFTANIEGQLQLSMNDVVGKFGNNDGSVAVQIEVQ
jgi:tetratricopeptide (TPR) repeat protein